MTWSSTVHFTDNLIFMTHTTLVQIMMLQSGLLMGGRVDVHDRFRDMRLDVDNMSYEARFTTNFYDKTLLFDLSVCPSVLLIVLFGMNGAGAP